MKHLSIIVGEYTYGLPLLLLLFLSDSGQGISPMKYRMLIKMDFDVIFVVASLCDCLKVYHHKTSDILRLALYQIINRNRQKYEQGIMPRSQLIILKQMNA